MPKTHHRPASGRVFRSGRTVRAAVIVAAVLFVVVVARAQDNATGGGLYSDEQAKGGESTFAAKCSACHGDSLEGGQMAPALRGSEFLATWTGRPIRRLYSRIISSMPPDEAGTLSEADTLGIVAFILRSNGYPAGPKAIEKAADLDTVTFSKP